MTLTQFSYYLRRFLPVGIIFFLCIIIFFYAFQLLLIGLSGPKKEILTFKTSGKIQPPILKNATTSAGLTFDLQTIAAEPITATLAAKVFTIPPVEGRFGYREKILLIAKNLGYDEDTLKYTLNGDLATFDDGTKKLQIDIKNFNFEYEFDVKKDETIFENAILPKKEEAKNAAIDLLTKLGRYSDEFAKGRNEFIYMKYDAATKDLSVLPDASNANVIEVDFYRADIDQINIVEDKDKRVDKAPVVEPKYYNSQNYVTMVFTSTGAKIIRGQVNLFEKSDGLDPLIYPLKTASVAWEDLKNGKGLVVSNFAKTPLIPIKKIFLGYADPEVYQEFLQPVYVFLGDDNFAAYVPAVTDKWMQQ